MVTSIRFVPYAVFLLALLQQRMQAEEPIRKLQSAVLKNERLVSVVFSPDGKAIYVGSGSPFEKGRLLVLDPDTLGVRVKHPSTLISRIARSPAGDLIATTDCLGLLSLYSTVSGKLLHEFEQVHRSGTELTGVRFSPDGKSLVTGGIDNLLVIWDVETRKHRHTIELSEPGALGCHFVFAINSKSDVVYARSDDRSIAKIDLATGKILDQARPRTKETDNHYIAGLALSPDDKTLALAFHDEAYSYKRDKPINKSPVVLVDAKTLKQKLTLGSHPYMGARYLKFTADGKFLISAGMDDSYCCIWDIEAGKLAATWRVMKPIPKSKHFFQLYGMDVSPDGRRLVTISQEGMIDLWDISKVTGAKEK